MGTLTECISLVGLSREDQAEIGADIQRAGSAREGVEAYAQRLVGELGTLRGQVLKGLEDAGQVPELDIPSFTAVRSQDADLLDQVPVERVFDADGNEVARTMSRFELAAELDEADEFVEQLGICAT